MRLGHPQRLGGSICRRWRRGCEEILKALIVVQVIAFKKEADHDFGVKAHGVAFKDAQRLHRSITGNP
jgi:hypothetical protein